VPSVLPLRRAQLAGLWAGFQRLIPDGAGRHLAAASGIALIVGVSAGFLLRGAGEDDGPGLAVLPDGRILVSGTLHQVLESLPSNEARAAGRRPGAAVRAVLTFRAKGGGYCREYEMAAPQGQFQGMACRQADGQWAVEAYVAQADAATGVHVVGNGEVLDKLAESRMEGDAFGKDEEKAAIGSRWK
jgi:hypothetical protein